MSWEGGAAIIAAISAIASVAAAIGAFRSAAHTRTATEATLAFEMRREYASPEMARALGVLREWADQQGSAFATRWAAEWAAGQANARTIDDARRRVASYFETAIGLYDAKMISLPTLRLVARLTGLHAVRDYILPLSDEIAPRAGLEPFHQLFRLCEVETIPIPTRPSFGSRRV